MKALEPSSCAAACARPEALAGRGASNASTTPATSGPSGPMIVRPTRSRFARTRRAPRRLRRRSRRCAPCGSVAVPALPGATNTWDTRGFLRALPRQRVLAPAAEPRSGLSCGIAQCRKWRMPVNTIAMPCSSAAAMTSSSRLRAAGLDDGLDAVFGGDVEAVAKREERVGGHHRALRRRASRPPPSWPRRGSNTRATHLSRADADASCLRARRRWRSISRTCTRATRTTGPRARAGVGLRFVTTRRSAALDHARSPALCTSRPPVTLRYSSAPGTRSRRAHRARARARSACRRAPWRASACTDGAAITSTNCRPTIAAAVAASSSRLKAMMPPNAEVGSVR